MTRDRRGAAASAGGDGMRAAVPLYRFRPPVGTPYGLEVTTLDDFAARYDPWPWDSRRPGRATFHYLVMITEGQLLHDVDHLTQTVDVGQWLWVRPGHAQGWHRPGTARGPFILFEPNLISPHIARLFAPALSHHAPSVLTPHVDDAPWLRQTAFQLLDEHRALGRRPLRMHHALCRSEALLIRLATSRAVDATPGGGDTYAQFVDVSSYGSANCTMRTSTPGCSDARREPSAARRVRRPGREPARSSMSDAFSKLSASWVCPAGTRTPSPPTSASATPRTSDASSARIPAKPPPPSPPTPTTAKCEGGKGGFPQRRCPRILPRVWSAHAARKFSTEGR